MAGRPPGGGAGRPSIEPRQAQVNRVGSPGRAAAICVTANEIRSTGSTGSFKASGEKNSAPRSFARVRGVVLREEDRGVSEGIRGDIREMIPMAGHCFNWPSSRVASDRGFS